MESLYSKRSAIKDFCGSGVGFRRLFTAVLSGNIALFTVCADDAALRPVRTGVVDIRDMGAMPDGRTLATEAIQKAVDLVSSAGGGTVYFPPGRWLTGTVRLKSNVTLHLENGCTVLGSDALSDYPEITPSVRSYTDKYVCRSLLYGENLENVTLRGSGTIDGQGEKFCWKEFDKRDRPFLIRMIRCKDVRVEDVHLRSSGMWMQHYLACERLRLRGVTVFNHASWNNDGVDIDGCRDVTISDCIIDTDDDSLCLKSTSPYPCENVTIVNCVLSSHCNALKMGTESTGGFKNITVSNCTIVSPRYSKPFWGIQRGMGGIALEIVDGGHLDGVAIANITITGVGTPLFLRLGNRARPHTEGAPEPAVGTFRNVVLSNILATGASKTGCAITGIPGHCIENLTLRDIRLEFEGGGTAEDAARKIEEKEADYPESLMFGTLPAYGIFGRHIKNLHVANVQLVAKSADARPASVYEDVEVQK